MLLYVLNSSSAQVQLPPPSHVPPPFAAYRGQGSQQPVRDKQALLANEKRRRAESYNAVERRRRDNINEKTNELATLH